jgi:hypothetical protein
MQGQHAVTVLSAQSPSKPFEIGPPGAHPARKVRVLSELLIEHFGK